jgi:hypothetical protein
MSLDLVVWLTCTVALPQGLPSHAEWSHHKFTAASLPGLSKELAALFEGQESWQVDRKQYLIRASYVDSAEKTQGTNNQPPRVDSPHGSAETVSKRQAELAAKVQRARLGISLVLEGSYEAGYPEQSAIATHLASKCGGAVVESPAGFYQVDTNGKWSQ